MNERAKALKEKLNVLKDQRNQLEASLKLAGGMDRSLKFQIASIKEEIIDCSRELRALVPTHRIGPQGAVSAGQENFKQDHQQYQNWFNKEAFDYSDDAVLSPHQQQLLALKHSMKLLTPKQQEYVAMNSEINQTAVGKLVHRHKSTISRTVKRGKTKLQKQIEGMVACMDSEDIYGRCVIDLRKPEVMKYVVNQLSTVQQSYLYLYYGEWMTLREIGSLLQKDFTSVYRTIVRALHIIRSLSLSPNIVVIGLDELEQWLICHFNEIPNSTEKSHRGRKKSNNLVNYTPTPSPQLYALEDTIITFVRSSESRDIQLRHILDDTMRTQNESWSSGKFLDMLRKKAKMAFYRRKKGRIRCFLKKLFSLLRRDYQ